MGKHRYAGAVAGNEQLRAAREAMPSQRHPGLPISRDELAERVCQWVANQHNGQELAFDGNHLGKLERGHVKRPGPLIRAGLCAVLDASEADLGFAPHPEAARVEAATTGRLHTDTTAIDAVAGVLAGLRRLEDATSAADVLPAVRQQAALTARLASNARIDSRAAAVGLLSELEQYQGWLSIPMGRWSDSRKHLDRAAVLALEADDPLRLSTALSFGAYRALRRDNLRTAESLSAAAGKDTRIHTGIRTYLKFQRAEVLARDGSRIEATTLLRQADEMVEHLPHEMPDSGYWYTVPFFLGQRAFVLAALGDIVAARQAAEESLAMMPEEWRTSEWASRRRRLATLDA